MLYLQKCINEALRLNNGNCEGLINLTEICISELQWWQKRVESGDDIYYPILQRTLYSDACPNDWGAACGKHSAGGNWSKEKSSFNINVLEMEVAYFALKIYAATLSETSVYIMVDKSPTLAWLTSKLLPIKLCI